MLLHDERNVRGFWKLAKIEELLKGSDGHVKGAVVRVPSRASTTILRRSLSQLYPLEIKCWPTVDLDEPSSSPQNNEVGEEPQQVQGRAQNQTKESGGITSHWMDEESGETDEWNLTITLLCVRMYVCIKHFIIIL